MILDIIEIQEAPARETDADVFRMTNQLEAEMAGDLRLATEQVLPSGRLILSPSSTARKIP
jgi:hypothetical protein